MLELFSAVQMTEAKRIALRLDDAKEWLYDPEIARRLGGRPFAVGPDQEIVYGAFATMVSRSLYFQRMNLKGVMAATEDNAISLLEEDTGFDSKSPVNYPFRIVWNYLNGIYPEIATDASTGDYVWPYDLNIDQKYMVLYYATYFEIPIERDFFQVYLNLFVRDLSDELQLALAKGQFNVVTGPHAFPTTSNFPQHLIRLAFNIRDMLNPTQRETIASALPTAYMQDMLYGKANVPEGYTEILPNVKGIYDYNDLTGKNLSVEILENGKSLGTYRVSDIANLSPDELDLADLGPATDQAYRSQGARSNFMRVIVASPNGVFTICEAPSRKVWFVPSLGILDQNNRYARVRFFAAP